jgi:hypothetical protein
MNGLQEFHHMRVAEFFRLNSTYSQHSIVLQNIGEYKHNTSSHINLLRLRKNEAAIRNVEKRALSRSLR